MTRNDIHPQVDEIVRRIRAKLKAVQGHDGSTAAQPPQTLPLLPVDFNHIGVPLRAADERWQQPALDSRSGGLKRRLATVLARILRRIDHGAVAQQEAFNAATIHTLAAFRDALGVSVSNVTQVNDQLAALTNTVAADQGHAARTAFAVESLAARQSELDARLAAVETASKQIATLHLDIAALGVDIAALGKRTQAIEGLTQAHSALRHDLTALASRLEALTVSLASAEAERADAHRLLGAHEERFGAHEERLGAHEERLGGTERNIRTVEDRTESTDRLLRSVESTVSSLPVLENRVAALETPEVTIATLSERLDRLHARLNGLDALTSTLGQLRQGIAEVRQRTASQEQRVAAVLEQARQRLPGPFGQEQLQALSEELAALEDSWYAALANRFRGSREEIQARGSIYLPIIEKAAAGAPDRPILDLGCGRGEVLELLKARRLEARGVDCNREMVRDCQARGLDITRADLVCYLSHLADDSAGAVLALHVIEHLPAASWAKLLAHTFRVLRPGGVAIFETPNPENVLVGAHAFYLDPTHRNPVPSALLSFLVEQQGFADVTVLPLRGVPPEQHVKESTEVAARFNDYFYGPLDYAVIGWKV